MQPRLNQDSYYGQVISYNGLSYKIEESKGDLIVLVDLNGNKIEVSKEELQRTAIWAYNFVDPEVVADFDERIAICEEKKLTAREYLKSCKEALNSLLDKFGVRFKHQLNGEKLAQVKNAEATKYSAIQNYTACKNESHSLYTSKLIYIT